ncbi:MAG: nucleotidyltransferase domain-containing protein [Deltaproteobacteria bacterium]|nr:nucleotidyltransferase domain-containing protein [Deltaproteobacteria bacterium]
MIELNAYELATTCDILKRYIKDGIVLAFGSRCNGEARKYSDLDLAICSNTPLDDLAFANMRADFDDSNLPFRVDIVNWADLDEDFQAAIKQKSVEILNISP